MIPPATGGIIFFKKVLLRYCIVMAKSSLCKSCCSDCLLAGSEACDLGPISIWISGDRRKPVCEIQSSKSNLINI